MEETAVFDGLKIYKGAAKRQFLLATRNPFFEHEVSIKISHEKIEFTRVGVDHTGKTRRFYSNNGVYQTSIYTYDLESGKFYFDKEESNEDTLTVYYAQP